MKVVWDSLLGGFRAAINTSSKVVFDPILNRVRVNDNIDKVFQDYLSGKILSLPNMHSVGGYTLRTIAFGLATGITDATILGALSAMDSSLIAYGLLAPGIAKTGKIKVLYPYVGGTATTCKFNFVDPQNTDAAYRLTFFGGWTFSSTGALPNGVDAYSNTHFNMKTSITQFKAAFGVYSRTNAVGSNFLYGGNDGVSQMAHDFSSGYQSNIAVPAITVETATNRMFINRRNANNDFQTYRDGVSLGTETTVQTGDNLDEDFYFGAYNLFGTPFFYNIQELAFSFLAEGFTNQNALDLTTTVNTFETALSRNV